MHYHSIINFLLLVSIIYLTPKAVSAFIIGQKHSASFLILLSVATAIANYCVGTNNSIVDLLPLRYQADRLHPATAVNRRACVINSIVVAAMFVSIIAVSIIDVLEPDALRYMKYFIVVFCLTLILSIWLEKTMRLATIMIMIWAVYYIYVFVQYGPFNNPYWLSTFVVHVVGLSILVWNSFSMIELESSDGKSIRKE